MNLIKCPYCNYEQAITKYNLIGQSTVCDIVRYINCMKCHNTFQHQQIGGKNQTLKLWVKEE